MFTFRRRMLPSPFRHPIDGIDGLENVIERAIDRILAGLQGQALVAHALQRRGFQAYFRHGQAPADDGAAGLDIRSSGRS